MPVDLRTRKLARLAVNCIEMKKGDKIILSGGSEAIPFLVELYKEVILRRGIPIVKVGLPDISDFFYKHATEEQLNHFPEYWFNTIKEAQGYIGIDTTGNTRELSNCSSEKIVKRGMIVNKISDYICNTREKIKRLTIAYPCQSLAQEAEMSNTEYENFVYGACLQDWTKIKVFSAKLLKKFKENSEVHLIGENVNLKFRVHGSRAVSDLKNLENMPAGEVFMAPIRDSLEGYIKFEYPSIRGGRIVEGIFLKFKGGKVIESSATKNEEFLKKMLSTDKNSSYVGEFGIGINPKITKYTNNLLFDEKMIGTIHLALGMAYKENGGGNDSAIHWDLVKDMKKSRIIVDGKLIQKNGKFL